MLIDLGKVLFLLSYILKFSLYRREVNDCTNIKKVQNFVQTNNIRARVSNLLLKLLTINMWTSLTQLGGVKTM